MAALTLVLHAHLGRYLPAGEPNARCQMELLPGESLAALLRRLGVPASEVLLMVDARGQRLAPEHQPLAGDVVELLPALSGG